MTKLLRIAILQYSPLFGAVSKNMERVDSILAKSLKEDKAPLDLLILPELAFTGYSFSSSTHISPFLESIASARESPTLKWAQRVSTRYNCHTLVGYPEKEFRRQHGSNNSSTDQNYSIFNSAVMTSPTGELVMNYRKHFLYMVDEKWGAFPGCSFEAKTIPSLHNLKLQLGICMDINPEKFEAPFDKFEFANFALENRPDLIVCPMAWTHPASPFLYPQKHQNAEQVFGSLDPSKVDYNTLEYWLTRMRPLLEKRPDTVLVMANRTGVEDDIIYAGTSSIIQIQNQEVKLLGSMGQAQEGLMVVEVLIPEGK